MDLTPTTTTHATGDPSWLGSAHGLDAPQTITLDLSTFTEGTHYPDGYLLSGTCLGKITSSGLYGPYDPDGSDGRETAAGFLLGDLDVSGGNDVGGALLVHGIVRESRLPFASGTDGGPDAAAKVDLAGKFTFV